MPNKYNIVTGTVEKMATNTGTKESSGKIKSYSEILAPPKKMHTRRDTKIADSQEQSRTTEVTADQSPSEQIARVNEVAQAEEKGDDHELVELQQEVALLTKRAAIASLKSQRETLRRAIAADQEQNQEGNRGTIAVSCTIGRKEEAAPGYADSPTERMMESTNYEHPRERAARQPAFDEISNKTVYRRRHRHRTSSSSSSSTSRSRERQRKQHRRYSLKNYTLDCKSPSKLSFPELMHASIGWIQAQSNLSMYDYQNYLYHLKYMSSRAQSGHFYDSAHANYDLSVRKMAETKGFEAFTSGSLELSLQCYGIEYLKPKNTSKPKFSTKTDFKSNGVKRACFHFNSQDGCTRTKDSCSFGHFCQKCNSTTHSKVKCPKE